MSRSSDDQPERLLVGEATDFERRMLEAVLRKGPSPAASARLARALGVTVTGVASVAAATTGAAEASVSKAAAAGATTATWPLISVGVLGLALAGGVVGARVWHGSSSGSRAASPSMIAPPAAADPASAPSFPAGGPSSSPSASRRAGSGTTGAGLGEQVALLDAARSAVSTGADRRAMEILRRYESKYPTGSFRPEATALKIEVLVKLGRGAEARSLAERFVIEHRGSLLARRVSELAGLPEPAGP